MKIILCPASGAAPAFAPLIPTLQERGYVVRVVPGYSAIDLARSQLATDALAQGAEEIIWIDSDIVFQPDDLERLRSHQQPIVCGIYPKKGTRALSCSLLPETTEVTFGQAGGLLEIRYAAAGFLYTRREVYADIARVCELPTCNQRFGRPLVPYFQPLVVSEPEAWYLGEDFAFCERTRRAGYRVYADTTIRLGHVGSYTYMWEDAGSAPPRFENYVYRVERGPGRTAPEG